MSTAIHPGSTLIRFFLLTMSVLLSVAATQAQARPLTNDDVEAFLATFKEMQTVLGDEEHSGVEDQIEADGGDMTMDFTSLYSGFVEEIRKHPPTTEKMTSMVQNHGFKNLDAWADVGDRVYSAYLAINMDGQPSMTQDEVDQYMASMDSAQIPEAEKSRMRNMMESAVESNKALRNVPEEDIEAVRPYAEQITELQMPEDDEY